MYITLTKKYAHESVFICLFLFSKIFMSKYNFFYLNVDESYETRTEKNAKKVKKKEKYQGPGKVHLFFLYCFSSSSSSSLLHYMAKAMAKFGRVVELKTTIKWGWKGKQGQNDVVLSCSF